MHACLRYLSAIARLHAYARPRIDHPGCAPGIRAAWPTDPGRRAHERLAVSPAPRRAKSARSSTTSTTTWQPCTCGSARYWSSRARAAGGAAKKLRRAFTGTSPPSRGQQRVCVAWGARGRARSCGRSPWRASPPAPTASTCTVQGGIRVSGGVAPRLLEHALRIIGRIRRVLATGGSLPCRTMRSRPARGRARHRPRRAGLRQPVRELPQVDGGRLRLVDDHRHELLPEQLLPLGVEAIPRPDALLRRESRAPPRQPASAALRCVQENVARSAAILTA